MVEYDSKNHVRSLKVLDLLLTSMGVIKKKFFGHALKKEIIKSSLLSFPYKTITVKLRAKAGNE